MGENILVRQRAVIDHRLVQHTLEAVAGRSGANSHPREVHAVYGGPHQLPVDEDLRAGIVPAKHQVDPFVQRGVQVLPRVSGAGRELPVGDAVEPESDFPKRDRAGQEDGCGVAIMEHHGTLPEYGPHHNVFRRPRAAHVRRPREIDTIGPEGPTENRGRCQAEEPYLAGHRPVIGPIEHATAGIDAVVVRGLIELVPVQWIGGADRRFPVRQ